MGTASIDLSGEETEELIDHDLSIMNRNMGRIADRHALRASLLHDKQGPGASFVTEKDLLGGGSPRLMTTDIRLKTAYLLFLVFLVPISRSHPVER